MLQNVSRRNHAQKHQHQHQQRLPIHQRVNTKSPAACRKVRSQVLRPWKLLMFSVSQSLRQLSLPATLVRFASQRERTRRVWGGGPGDSPFFKPGQVASPAASSDYVGQIAEPETASSSAEESSLLSEPGSYEPAQEPPASSIGKRRYGQDAELPVDVANDEERRLHNDARRFARLLISEIKLYNEQKVVEGRSEHDLYDRLREYIDRSREMYDKRVKAEVAARYDYFHGELVNTLAEGDASKLGSNYPGATVNV